MTNVDFTIEQVDTLAREGFERASMGNIQAGDLVAVPADADGDLRIVHVETLTRREPVANVERMTRHGLVHAGTASATLFVAEGTDTAGRPSVVSWLHLQGLPREQAPAPGDYYTDTVCFIRRST